MILGGLWSKCITLINTIIITCRMSAEEIRNQKLLLEYYKQQQESKQKRKVEKAKKKTKGKRQK